MEPKRRTSCPLVTRAAEASSVTATAVPRRRFGRSEADPPEPDPEPAEAGAAERTTREDEQRGQRCVEAWANRTGGSSPLHRPNDPTSRPRSAARSASARRGLPRMAYHRPPNGWPEKSRVHPSAPRAAAGNTRGSRSDPFPRRRPQEGAARWPARISQRSTGIGGVACLPGSPRCCSSGAGTLTIVTAFLAAPGLDFPGHRGGGRHSLIGGIAVWFAPWERWPDNASLLLIPPALDARRPRQRVRAPQPGDVQRVLHGDPRLDRPGVSAADVVVRRAAHDDRVRAAVAVHRRGSHGGGDVGRS